MRFSILLRSLFLTALCLLPAISHAETILVFGDSLSAAYGIPRESGWVHLLQQKLQRTHPRYHVVNASISGETASGGVQRIASTLKQHRPAIVILELGANDGMRGTPVASIEASLGTLIQQARKTQTKVLLLGMQLPPNYGSEYTSRFKAMYAKLAQRYRIPLVPFLLEGVKPEQFQADNLHPTAEAQPLILDTVWQKLLLLL